MTFRKSFSIELGYADIQFLTMISYTVLALIATPVMLAYSVSWIETIGILGGVGVFLLAFCLLTVIIPAFENYKKYNARLAEEQNYSRG